MASRSKSYSEIEYIDILQKIYNANLQRIKNDTSINGIEHIVLALSEAEKIWLNVQVLIKSPQYSKMNDEEKINLIESDFKEFYKNFPIVSRYMICLGQYKMKAFKRMLIKSSNESVEPSNNDNNDNNDDNNNNDKTKNERKWIERQADYVRFLWEEYQNNNFDIKDSDNIWHHTYDTLTKEFKEFKELHEKMEQKVKRDALKHKKELLYEMGERIVTGKQSLSDSDSKDLLNKLLDKLYKQRFKKLIKQICLEVQFIEHSIEGVGINEYARTEYEEALQQSFYKKTYKKMDISKIMS